MLVVMKKLIRSSVTPWKDDHTVEARLMIILKRDEGQFCIYVKQMNEMDKQVDKGSLVASSTWIKFYIIMKLATRVCGVCSSYSIQ